MHNDIDSQTPRILNEKGKKWWKNFFDTMSRKKYHSFVGKEIESLKIVFSVFILCFDKSYIKYVFLTILKIINNKKVYTTFFCGSVLKLEICLTY